MSEARVSLSPRAVNLGRSKDHLHQRRWR